MLFIATLEFVFLSRPLHCYYMPYIEMTRPKRPTIAAFHGAWLDASCFGGILQELGENGYPGKAIELPIDRPGLTYDHYAERGVEELRSEAEVVLIGLSMSGNVIARVARRLEQLRVPVRRMIYIASGIDRSTISSLPPARTAALPEPFTPEFKQVLNLPVPDPDQHRRLFFSSRIDPAAQARIMDRMRVQHRAPVQPPLGGWYSAAIPNTSLYFTEDQVIAPEFSLAFSQEVLGTSPLALAGGHCDFIAEPGPVSTVILNTLEAASA